MLWSSATVFFFDLDGVLVDSQGAENDALRDLADLVGVPLSAPDAERLFTGRRVAESVEYIAQVAGAPMPADPVAFVRARCEELMAGRLHPVPGVASALSAIDLPKYVVSNSPLQMIRDRLRMTGLDHHFPGEHFSAYELGTWKPDPGLYLAAAAAVGARPDEAVVVEDSVVGVQAAVAAGMNVLWYRPRADDDEPTLPGVQTFSDMNDLWLSHVDSSSIIRG